MKKKYYLSISSFFIIILFFIINMNFLPNQVSAIDNRTLEELPNPKNSGDFTDAVESYIADRIGYRTEIINFYNIANNKIFNMMLHPTYTYGRDGYVFLKVHPELEDFDYMGSFAEFMAKIQKYCKDRGVGFVYNLNPSKTTVYKEYLPEGVNFRNKRILKLIEGLEELNVNYVYTAPALMEAKKTQQVYNVKYDAGHWNDRGAYVGISQVYENLATQYPELSIKDMDEFYVEKKLVTSLPVSYFPINEEIETFQLKESTAVKDTSFDDEIQILKGYPYFSRFIADNSPSLLKVLIFRGSYYNDREKFFIDEFSETTMIHSYYNSIAFDYYFNIFQPDLVIFESAEYATTTNYFPQERIDNAIYNEPYSTYEALPVKDSISLAKVNEKIAVDQYKALTDVELKVEGEEISRAYALVNGKYYDFKITETEVGRTIKCTFNNEDLKEQEEMSILLVSENMDFQSVIKIQYEVH